MAKLRFLRLQLPSHATDVPALSGRTAEDTTPYTGEV